MHVYLNCIHNVTHGDTPLDAATISHLTCLKVSAYWVFYIVFYLVLCKYISFFLLHIGDCTFFSIHSMCMCVWGSFECHDTL